MGGVSGDNIEGLSNFAAHLDGAVVATATILAARADFYPVVESISIRLTGGSVAGTCKVQVFETSVRDQVTANAAITTIEHVNISRVKLNTAKNALVRVVITGTGTTADVHIDGRWVGGDGPNFS